MDGHRVVFVNGAFCFFYLSSQQSIPVYTEGREIERRKEGKRKRKGEEERGKEKEGDQENIQRSFCQTKVLIEFLDSARWGCRYSEVVVLPWRWNTSCWRGSLIVSLSFTPIYSISYLIHGCSGICERLTGRGLGKRVMQSWKSEVFNWSIVSAKPLNGSQKCDVIKADRLCNPRSAKELFLIYATRQKYMDTPGLEMRMVNNIFTSVQKSKKMFAEV